MGLERRDHGELPFWGPLRWAVNVDRVVDTGHLDWFRWSHFGRLLLFGFRGRLRQVCGPESISIVHRFLFEDSPESFEALEDKLRGAQLDSEVSRCLGQFLPFLQYSFNQFLPGLCHQKDLYLIGYLAIPLNSAIRTSLSWLAARRGISLSLITVAHHLNNLRLNIISLTNNHSLYP